MKTIERLAWSCSLLVVAAFSFFTFIETRDLAGEMRQQSQALSRTLTETTMLPGIPSELHEAWRAASGDHPPPHYDDLLWYTFGVTNEGYQESGYNKVTIELTKPIAALESVRVEGLTATTRKFTPVPVSDIDPDAGTASVEFGDLAAGRTHWIFMAVTPDSVRGRVDQERWARLAPTFLRSVTATSARDRGAAQQITETDFGLGALDPIELPAASRRKEG